MIALTLQSAFGWEKETADLIGHLASTLSKESIELSDIVSAIKAKDSDNDITVANNWIKYLFDTIFTGVKDKALSLTTDTDVADIINKMSDNFNPVINGKDSSFGNILDVFITKEYSYFDYANALIGEIVKADTYWKSVICDNS